MVHSYTTPRYMTNYLGTIVDIMCDTVDTWLAQCDRAVCGDQGLLLPWRYPARTQAPVLKELQVVITQRHLVPISGMHSLASRLPC